MKKKLLLVSDAISGNSGLARITRDLAVRIHANLSDVYDLATAGYGGITSCKFGFHQYCLEGVQSDWVLPSLPEIVNDFAGEERCIVMFISDPSRLGWFSNLYNNGQHRIAEDTLSKYPGLKQWLMTANIERWLYAPIDASGPNDRLTFPLALTLLGFDRLLAYGPFGEDVIRKTIGDQESDKRNLTNIPHGIDSSVFYEMPRKLSRKLFFQYTGAQPLLAMLGVNPEIKPIEDDEVLVGICATNQSRKDCPLALETCAILAQNRKIRVWIHTDALERSFSIPSLLVDFGLLDKTVISLDTIPDIKLASAYSACDFTIGAGPEGWGFPLMESQFCGTPVVHGSYAGGADIVPKEWQIDPECFRYEGSYSCKRPVYQAWKWAGMADVLIGKRCDTPNRYDWHNLWLDEWEPWFRESAK